jgi:hypothetical protein
MALLLSLPVQAADQPSITLPVPRLVYTSPFTGQLPHADAPPIDWARSNALVGALGGHAGHLRGTSRGTSSATSATLAVPPVPSPSAAPAHGHHGTPERVR